MEFVAAGIICGIAAATPGAILLELVTKGRSKAGMGRAFIALGFAFALLTAGLAAVYVQRREYVPTFGVSAIGVFLVIWLVMAVRTLRTSR